jgi:hypothetical protein
MKHEVMQKYSESTELCQRAEYRFAVGEEFMQK